MIQRFAIILALAAFSLFFTACGGGGGMGGGGSSLKEAQALNANISGSYKAFTDNYEGLKTNASGFAAVPADVDLSAIDPADIQKMFTDCLNAPVEVATKAESDAGKAAGGDNKAGQKGFNALKTGVDDIKSCPGALEGAGEAKVEGANAEAMKTLQLKVQTIDTMRKQLYLIPAQAQAFGTLIKDSTVEFGKIKGANLAAFEASKVNPMADKAKAKSEHDKTEAELKSVETLLQETLPNDLKTIPVESANIGKQLLQDISNFPAQPGS